MILVIYPFYYYNLHMCNSYFFYSNKIISQGKEHKNKSVNSICLSRVKSPSYRVQREKGWQCCWVWELGVHGRRLLLLLIFFSINLTLHEDPSSSNANSQSLLSLHNNNPFLFVFVSLLLQLVTFTLVVPELPSSTTCLPGPFFYLQKKKFNF